MPKTLDTARVALIRKLGAQGLSQSEVAWGAEVSLTTVRRYLELADMLPRRHEARNPLYDPLRDGEPALSLTARLMGDPAPGRRELVARRNGPLVEPHDPARRR